MVTPGQAAEIVFDSATKVYGDGAPAVDQLSLTVPAGEICVLVGPSGGGKTTALQLVNRLIELTSGDIRIDGRSIETLDVDRAASRHRLRDPAGGAVPHLTIEANIGTVPRLSGGRASGHAPASRELLELVGLDPSYAGAIRRSCRAASASASASPARWPPTRR